MKTTRLFFGKNILTGISLMLLFIVSCTKNEEATTLVDTEVNATETEKNILDFISGRQDATIFNEIIETSSPELKELLSGDEKYTIFVPTDQAWENFFHSFEVYNSIDDLTIEKRNDLRDLIVKYHTVKGIFLSSGFQDRQKFESLAGQPFTALLDEDNIYMEDNTANVFNGYEDGSKLIEADSIVSNGVVHFIDAVLIPEGFTQTLARKIIERDDTSIFEEALRKTDMLNYFMDVTRSAGLIPTDMAWKTCFELLGDDFNSIDDFDTEEELDLLKKIILEHLTYSSGEGFGQTDVLDGDKQLVFRDYIENAMYGFKDATGLVTRIQDRDPFVENKCELFIIDRVLLPKVAVDYILDNYKASLMDFIMKLDDCKSLNEAFAALPKEQLPSFLKNGTPFTLFLPTKKALTALENEYGDLNTQEGREILANVLGYHFIYGQKIASSDISFGQPYETFQYEPLSFEQGDGVINIIDSKGSQSATVISADHDISGGTIHVIDNVLLPAELDYYQDN